MISLKINEEIASKSFISSEIKVPVYISDDSFYNINVTDPLVGMDPIAIVFLNNLHNSIAIKFLSEGLCIYQNGMWKIKGKVFKAVISNGIKVIFSDKLNDMGLSFIYEIKNEEPADFIFSLELIGEAKFSDNSMYKEFDLPAESVKQFTILLNTENSYCLLKPSIKSLVTISWKEIL